MAGVDQCLGILGKVIVQVVAELEQCGSQQGSDG
jgi:hypothetical protein